jgi:hypothetical protein
LRSRDSLDSLLCIIIGILLLLSIPLLITTFFLVLGNTIEDGVVNFLTMILLTRRLYLDTLCIVGVLNITIWILAARKSYFYLLGIPLQVMIIFVSFMLWLAFSPKITLSSFIAQDSIEYYLGIMSPNGNYELSVFECEKQQCKINRLFYTDSDPIVDATFRLGGACGNYYVAQAVTSSGSIIEHGVNIQSTTQLCQD